ncbi:MAG TPA: DUF2239 family protein [Spongiibacteraceae bacterium]|nr:DUF2239 family protein [Spongiibacteraceae bacterium]
MSEAFSKPCTAFAGHRLLVAGPLIEVALALKNAIASETATPILAFDDASGRVVDFDLRGSKAELIARLAQLPANTASPNMPSIKEESTSASNGETVGRGRPKLGVIAREVTLLPRHWDWLAAQSGGASATLRRLVEEARRSAGSTQEVRKAQEAAYRFMSAIAGDLPGFEEATRALFADDRARFKKQIVDWPKDVRDYAAKLAFGTDL